MDSIPTPSSAADPRVALARKLAALAEWAGKVRVDAADLLDVARAYGAYCEQDARARDLAEAAGEVGMDLVKLDASSQRLVTAAARAVHGIADDLADVVQPLADSGPQP